MGRKLTTEEWVRRASNLHSGKFDYSKVEYNGNKEFVIISCPIHGEFEQRPVDHERTYGCPKCGEELGAKKRAMDTSSWIARAAKSNPQYSYHLVRYVNAHTEVEIVCPDHGSFFQTPSNHDAGKGCKYCANNVKLTMDEWIELAKSVHGEEYDYSKVIYKNAQTKVIITCRKHGDFEQTPNSHSSRGSGCPKCGDERVSAQLAMTTQEFIDRANIVHNGKFNYSRTTYVSGHVKVTVECPVHGSIEVDPYNHLYGTDCASCADYGIKPHHPGIFYVNAITNEEGDVLEYKGGVTNNHYSERFGHQKTSLKKNYPNLGYKHIEYISFDLARDALDIEYELKKEKLRPSRNFDGGTELFLENPIDLAISMGLIPSDIERRKES